MFRGRIVDYETSTSLFVFDMDSKIKTTDNKRTASTTFLQYTKRPGKSQKLATLFCSSITLHESDNNSSEIMPEWRRTN